jgi:hypothetical protein
MTALVFVARAPLPVPWRVLVAAAAATAAAPTTVASFLN